MQTNDLQAPYKSSPPLPVPNQINPVHDPIRFLKD